MATYLGRYHGGRLPKLWIWAAYCEKFSFSRRLILKGTDPSLKNHTRSIKWIMRSIAKRVKIPLCINIRSSIWPSSDHIGHKYGLFCSVCHPSRTPRIIAFWLSWSFEHNSTISSWSAFSKTWLENCRTVQVPSSLNGKGIVHPLFSSSMKLSLSDWETGGVTSDSGSRAIDGSLELAGTSIENVPQWKGSYVLDKCNKDEPKESSEGRVPDDTGEQDPEAMAAGQTYAHPWQYKQIIVQVPKCAWIKFWRFLMRPSRSSMRFSCSCVFVRFVIRSICRFASLCAEDSTRPEDQGLAGFGEDRNVCVDMWMDHSWNNVIHHRAATTTERPRIP